jgi:hypothetical protein
MKLGLRLFRRAPLPVLTPALPEFGVRVTLRRGDKIVRRDAHGAIVISSVCEERTDATEILGTPVMAARDRASRRRSRR